MELFRIHAYEVTPQRLAKDVIPPRGGVFSADVIFTKALDDYVQNSKLQSQASYDLRREKPADGDTSPNHDLRNTLLQYCYGTTPTAKKAAVRLSSRLGKSMDNRSVFTLFLLTAYKEDNLRRLVMWAFPKDEPFHFSVHGDRAKLKILKDAFSRSSFFKKAALFEGTNNPNAFWSCRVIDKQAESESGGAAQYWVNLFLDSNPSLSGKAGTRLLARCLKRTHDALVDQAEKDQLSSSIVGIRVSQRSHWSLRQFADEFLTDNTKKAFLESSPPESLSNPFVLNKPEFDQKINLRIFRLEDNVMVSAPFQTIGRSVTIEEGVAERRLRCEGRIVSEKVGAQHV